jgi:hypothetical protein
MGNILEVLLIIIPSTNKRDRHFHHKPLEAVYQSRVHRHIPPDADLIEEENKFMLITPGQSISLSQLITTYNSTDIFCPYNLFVL